MQIIDFSRLIADGFMPDNAWLADNVYDGLDGIHYRFGDRNGALLQDIVEISPDVFLFSSDYAPNGSSNHNQIVCDSDWILVQFRMKGSGYENISELDILETPENSCIVTRYPSNTVIERHIDVADRWRVVCLLFSPKGLTDLLDLSPSRLPEGAAWVGREGALDLHSRILPLEPGMMLAVNDILACSYRGGIRKAYMRAKSLELLTAIVHRMDAPSVGRDTTKCLSKAEVAKITLARHMMTADLEARLTLAQLARRVGLNRTKLALGFKEVFGISVQAFWRDVKLNHARELLRDDRALVTEVALSVGYSELSSFTRAFNRKFGMLPRDCRGPGRRRITSSLDSRKRSGSIGIGGRPVLK